MALTSPHIAVPLAVAVKEESSSVEIASPTRWLNVDLSWGRPSRQVLSDASSIDVALSAVIMRSDGKFVDAAPNRWECPDPDLASTRSSVSVELDASTAATARVAQVFIVAEIRAPSTLDWKLLRRLRCHILTGHGTELASYDLKHYVKHASQRIIVGRLFYNAPRWTFQVVGQSIDASDLSDAIHPDLQTAPSQLTCKVLRPGFVAWHQRVLPRRGIAEKTQRDAINCHRPKPGSSDEEAMSEVSTCADSDVGTFLSSNMISL